MYTEVSKENNLDRRRKQEMELKLKHYRDNPPEYKKDLIRLLNQNDEESEVEEMEAEE